MGFTNIHLTAWCDATIDVPHLGKAFSLHHSIRVRVRPHLVMSKSFCLINRILLFSLQASLSAQLDLRCSSIATSSHGHNPQTTAVIRCHLIISKLTHRLALSLSSYELALNPEHLKYLETLNAIALELHKDPEIVEFHSPSAFIRSTISPVGLCGLITEEVFNKKVKHHMIKYVETWLELVEKAETVDAATQYTLKTRDYAWRKNLTDLDPANMFATKACGEEMKNKLVRCLQGADRAIPSKVNPVKPGSGGLPLVNFAAFLVLVASFFILPKFR